MPRQYEEENLKMNKRNRLCAEQHIVFLRPVLLEEWEKFCEANGIDFAPSLGRFNVYVGYGVEIVLDSYGKRQENNQVVPPESFTSLTVMYDADDVRTERMLIDLCQKFDAANTKDIFESRIRSVREAVEKEVGNILRLGQTTTEALVERISEQLENLVNNNRSLCHASVLNSDEKHVTWKDLYPAFWARQKAKFARKVMRFPVERLGPPNAFFRFLGYREQSHAFVDEERLQALSDTFDDEAQIHIEAIKLGIVSTYKTSLLSVPYSQTVVDIAVVPVVPVDKIKFKFTVGESIEGV